MAAAWIRWIRLACLSITLSPRIAATVGVTARHRYGITRSKERFFQRSIFNPLWLSLLVLHFFTATAGASEISGTVSAAGSGPLSGVLIMARQVSSGKVFIASTNKRGRYELEGISNGSYQVRAAKKDYVFSPSSVLVTINRNDAEHTDFVGMVVALSSIAVSPANGANGNINQGYTQQFTATGTYSDGTTRDLTAQVSWSSSDTAKATIGTSGLATSMATGSTTIKATVGTIFGTSTLNVNPAFDMLAAQGVCTDTDGDGFCDTWEDADYIDVNGNGVYDSGVDFAFPHRTPYIFSAVTHSGTGGGNVFPTVFDPQSATNHNVVLTIVSDSTGVGTGTFTYTIDGGPASAPQEIRPVVNLGASNVRVVFYGGAGGSNYVSGDTFSFSVSTGADTKVADKNTPNIYVQYDYMGYDAPGAACTVDADCDGGGLHLNDVCHSGYCNHNHYPVDPLYRKVVDAFDRHNITLYIDPQRNEVPHAQVITFSKPGDGSVPAGYLAACAGWDVVSGDITTGGAVNFHDIKYRPGSVFSMDPMRRNSVHYAVLSHSNTCLVQSVGLVGNCDACPPDRSIPRSTPNAKSSGTAELPGNDFIVSLGNSLNDSVAQTPTTPFLEEGVFMHELGHNLGLHHSGDLGAPVSAPNYLSVMNYKYSLSGITHAATPGGKIAVEALRELNYSEHELNTLTETSLDESAGVSPLSAGYTGIIRFKNAVGGNGSGPESGPVDWSGNGSIDPGTVSVDLNLYNGATETMKGYRDWDHDAVSGGACTSSADCRANAIRKNIRDFVDPTLDPHEPCVRGRCQALWFPAARRPWGND